jgi:predicted Fe-S protein YdhL (DUF1289 family)
MSLGHEAVSKRRGVAVSADDTPNQTSGGSPRDFDAERQAARERRRAERRRLLASGPPSPCVSVCQMDPMTGYCVGCLRTIDEIRDWIISTPDERQKILDQLPGRKERSGL